MTIIHYSTPQPFHKTMGTRNIVIMKRNEENTMDRFSGFADHGGVPFEKARVPEKKKPNSRFAGYAGIDEEGYMPSLKRDNNVTDIDSPYYKMFDRQALARQSQTGESYASAFAKVYTDPRNIAIRDAAQYEHLARGEDNICGTRLATPTTQKAAPADALQDDVDPGSAEYELHSRVITRMKNEPGMSYQRAFTHEYLDPANRSLKERVTSEGIIRMQARAPAPSFPRYTAPGHAGEASNVGRSGKKPANYAGG
jgi:hypothetical protein